MTKEQYIELINRRFPNRWHPDYIAAMIAKVLNQLMYETFKTDPQMLLKYCTEKELVVTCNDGSYLAEFDFPLIDVAGPGGGIRMIKTSKGDNINFTFMTQYQYMIMKDLEVSKLYDTIRCVLIGKKIYFKGKRIESLEGEKLLTYALIPIEGLDDDDEIPIPAGLEITLLTMLFQVLGVKPPDDLVNDRNEKTK